jgi:heme-degrading monooxygenase HmoA
MVLEIADIEILDGMAEEFERNVPKGLSIFRQAKGFVSLKLMKSIEKANRYKLLIEWETVEDHIVTFAGSDGLRQWRALVGHCFARPTRVEHCEAV